MFPTLRQRLILLAACAMGGWWYTRAGGLLQSPDGGSGYSLWFAHGGWVSAVFMLLLLGLPVIVMGVMASIGGHLLSGLFVVAMSWLVLSATGGPIDGWLHQSRLPTDYRGLIFESLIWVVLIVVLALLMQLGRKVLRQKWPSLAATDHYGIDHRLDLPGAQAWGAGLVCAVVGALVSFVLIRTSDSGQVIGSLLLAFALGGLASQLLFPQNKNALVVLVAPMLVAAGVYGYGLWQYQHGEQLLSAWYRGRLIGPALALPMHFAGAGLAGAIIGIGWGQGLQVDGQIEKPVQSTAEKPTEQPPVTQAGSAPGA